MRVLIISFLLISISVCAWAQDVDPLDQMIRNLAADPAPDPDDFAQNYAKLRLIRQAGKQQFEELLAFRRADIQSGASSGASGSTSAVLSPLLPAIFGLSFETGAITRSITGNTITFKVNPVGLLCASGADAAAVARRSDEACKVFWKRAGFTASFDTSRGEKKPQLESLDALSSQFSELSVRFEVINQRTLTGQDYNRRFGTVAEFNRKAQDLVTTMAATLPPALTTDYSAKVSEAVTQVMATEGYKSANAAGKANLLRAAIDPIAPPPFPEEQAIANLQRQWVDTLGAFQKQQDAVLNAPVLTAVYSYQQPDVATAATASAIVPVGTRPPNVHTAGLVYAQGILSAKMDLTANATASWFNEVRPGMPDAFRDFRAGFQATFKLRQLNGYGVPTLTFAGLYTYLHQQPLGLGLVAFNQAQIKEKGHIGLFQGKLELPAGKNAIRIPVSFTYSNRTELIKESEVRGQIGLSFNLDQLFDFK
jgi:hypothetical protein